MIENGHGHFYYQIVTVVSLFVCREVVKKWPHLIQSGTFFAILSPIFWFRQLITAIILIGKLSLSMLDNLAYVSRDTPDW